MSTKIQRSQFPVVFVRSATKISESGLSAHRPARVDKHWCNDAAWKRERTVQGENQRVCPIPLRGVSGIRVVVSLSLQFIQPMVCNGRKINCRIPSAYNRQWAKNIRVDRTHRMPVGKHHTDARTVSHTRQTG